VVGAGYAGLTAALRLREMGRRVVVVEARDRVGGRTCSEAAPDGTIIDHGGQWVGPSQERLLALAGRFGVETFAVYDQGKNIEYRDGRRHLYDGPISDADPKAAADIIETILDVDLLALEVPLDAPWRAERAGEWDGQTFETWLERNASSPHVAEMLTLFVEAVLCCEPRDVSALHVLFYIHSAGGVQKLIGVRGNAQDSRFVGGAQETAKRVARELGSAVILAAPVRDIVSADHVEVRYDGGPARDGGVVRAMRTVVAIPPTLAGRINYTPPLPGYRDQLTQRVPMASTIKVHCIYPTPFWREEGLSGQVTSLEGIAQFTFDNSPADGSKGVLVAFIEADHAREWGRRPAAEREAAVKECLAAYFGPRAAAPQHYLERSWHEEAYTRGCYGGLMPPGAWVSYGRALREPCGLIHWAGTETAENWSGYIDGAISSGERVAAEVQAALG
jgi:monoamine oxidase